MRERHGMVGTSTYGSWVRAKNRCFNPNDKNYPRYGGRGITMCDAWRDSFVAFYEDMGDRPLGMTLDRIDNDKGYEPGNCRWATVREQNFNRRVFDKSQSGYQGITKHKGGKWLVQVPVRNRYVGLFDELEDAKQARSVAMQAVIREAELERRELLDTISKKEKKTNSKGGK